EGREWRPVARSDDGCGPGGGSAASGGTPPSTPSFQTGALGGRFSEAEAAQGGVIVRSPAERPAKLAVLLTNGQVIDGRMTCRHEPLLIELPVLVAIGPKPVPGVVMPFVGESDSDSVALKRPELLDQSVVQLSVPFTSQKRDDLLPSDDELRPVTPTALRTVSQGDPLGVPGIPAILGHPHLLGRGLGRKRWQWRSGVSEAYTAVDEEGASMSLPFVSMPWGSPPL